MGERVAYIRASTEVQEVEIQRQKVGKCHKVFEEKVSGANFDRPSLQKALDYVREGDTFVVCSIDRLARSTMDLLKIVEYLEEQKVRLEILDINLDTSTPVGRAMLTMLGAIAELERGLIRKRTEEGREAAKAKGIKFGPKFKLSEKQLFRLLADVEKGELSKGEIAKKYKISRPSVYRYAALARELKGYDPRQVELVDYLGDDLVS